MEYTAGSITESWSLDAVLALLQQNKQVEGLMLIGSLAKKELTPVSDYDLIIVLRDAPQTWWVGVTTIENRPSDLIFVHAAALQSIQELSSPVPTSHDLTPIIRWLQHGLIRFDRFGQLAQAQQKAQHREWVSLSDEDAYSAWFALNYNLAVAKRMLSSNTYLYKVTAGIRMAVYGHSDLWWGYFKIRKIAWDGDKAAVQYLQKNDPEFLETYQQFIQSTPLDQKLWLYEEATRIAAAPLGGIWPSSISAMNHARSLPLWQNLLGEAGHEIFLQP